MHSFLQTTQAFTDVITDGVRLRMRWWGGVDLLRRLMFIVSLTVFDIFLPDYVQVLIMYIEPEVYSHIHYHTLL